MKTTLIAAAIAFATTAVFGQQQATIEHHPSECVQAEEMPLMLVTTHEKGTLRAYFRKVGSTDWCSVDGFNDGAASRVVLPKVDPGDQLEYYFVVLDKDRILAKSPRIYQTKAIENCPTPFARHSMLITLTCLPPSQNPVASSMAAGYQAKTATPNNISPESPAITSGSH